MVLRFSSFGFIVWKCHWCSLLYWWCLTGDREDQCLWTRAQGTLSREQKDKKPSSQPFNQSFPLPLCLVQTYWVSVTHLESTSCLSPSRVLKARSQSKNDWRLSQRASTKPQLLKQTEFPLDRYFLDLLQW